MLLLSQGSPQMIGSPCKKVRTISCSSSTENDSGEVCIFFLTTFQDLSVFFSSKLFDLNSKNAEFSTN